MNCNEMGSLGEPVHDNPNESFFLVVRGKPTIKSILISSYFHTGIDKGWSTPADFKWLAFILWQVSHSDTYLAISTFILDHQKFSFKS
jgi:hypothetical protein